MSFMAEVVSIFISSPGDVSADREAVVKAVMHWNQRNGRARGIFFNPLTWESLVAPDIGESGQAVIESQIGNDYDIYLGLMWARFGTPTLKAKSGTEDEFMLAVDRYRNGDSISVSFLFKNSPMSPSNIDHEQLKKVQEFRDFVAKAGCLYREYDDHTTLESFLNLILDSYVNKRKSPSGNDKIESKLNMQHQSSDAAIINHMEELGLIDFQEISSENTDRYLKISSQWSLQLESLGDEASKVSDTLNSMSRFGKMDPASVKPVVNKLAKFIDDTCEWGEKRQIEMDECLDNMAFALNGIAKVSVDFEQNQDQINDALMSVNNLIDALNTTNSSISELSKTVLSTPRMTAKLNKANKRLSELLDSMRHKNESFLSNVIITRDEISKMSV